MKRFLRTELVRDVFKLVVGVGAGRIVLFVALPLATLIYSPAQFELLAVLMAVVTTISVAACLRFDVAIPVADSDEEAAYLLVISLCAAMIFALVLLVPVLIAPNWLARAIGTPRIAQYLWLVPFGVLLVASYSALQFWAVRRRQFGAIARTRVSQAIVGASFMLGVGWVSMSSYGLLVGTLLTICAGGGVLAWQALRLDRPMLKSVNLPRMGQVVRQFKKYPLISTPDALANIGGIQVPIIIIAAASETEAGQLFLAIQILNAPIALFGASIGQVYASRLPQAQSDGTLAPLTLKVMQNLALVGVVPLCVIGLLAPLLMGRILGSEWELAGSIMSFMVPWVVLQLLSSPISFVMLATGRQNSMLALTCFGGLLRIAAVSFAVQNGAAIYSLAHIWSSAVFYLVCLLVYARASSVIRLPEFRVLVLCVVLALIGYGAASFVVAQQGV